MEAMARYDAMPRAESADERVRRTAMHDMPVSFSTAELIAKCVGVNATTVRRIVQQLLAEGKLTRQGRGRGTRWVRAV